MTTTATIVELGPRDGPEPDHTGVVPAIEAGADPIDAFVSASPTSSERNQNMTAEEALGQLEQVGAAGRDASRAARAVGRRRAGADLVPPARESTRVPAGDRLMAVRARR